MGVAALSAPSLGRDPKEVPILSKEDCSSGMCDLRAGSKHRERVRALPAGPQMATA